MWPTWQMQTPDTSQNNRNRFCAGWRDPKGCRPVLGIRYAGLASLGQEEEQDGNARDLAVTPSSGSTRRRVPPVPEAPFCRPPSSTQVPRRWPTPHGTQGRAFLPRRRRVPAGSMFSLPLGDTTRSCFAVRHSFRTCRQKLQEAMNGPQRRLRPTVHSVHSCQQATRPHCTSPLLIWQDGRDDRANERASG
jgi:hypothetical protein